MVRAAEAIFSTRPHDVDARHRHQRALTFGIRAWPSGVEHNAEGGRESLSSME